MRPPATLALALRAGVGRSLIHYTMIRKLALALVLIAAQATCRAATPLRLDVVEHRLNNGLTLLILEHHQAPVVSCSIVYRVGSVNEEPGHTGITHLLEHMMFKGTATIGAGNFKHEEDLLKKIDTLHARLEKLENIEGNKDAYKIEETREELALSLKQADAFATENELWEIYRRSGATGINAGTGRDMTTYYCSLPVNRLELWMWLESDRMWNAVFRGFYKEKDVVLEERRLVIEDSPNGFFFERLFAAAFIAHPYRWPIIGWKSDIENISREMIKTYYRRYYAPNNTIAVIVGDIEPEKVIGMAERYFGRIPAQTPPPPVVTKEPLHRGKRELCLKFNASPRLALAYNKPSVGADDNYALEIIEKILSHGRTSRLYKSLVEEKRIAVSASAFNPPTRYPSLFIIYAIPRAPHSIEEVERALLEELDKLKREPPGDWEMEKALNQIEADFVRGLESTSGLASQIGHFEAIDKWEYINSYIPKIRAVTPEDVTRVANHYLKEDNCTLVTLQK